MAIYCVSYDLNKAGQNYAGLYEELKRTGTWWHYLDSTWLIDTSESVQQITDRLLQRIDKNDSLLVIRVTREYQGWLTKAAWDWINGRSF